MRLEAASEIKDSMVLTVEACDERAQILNTLGQLTHRRVIVTLSDDAIFRRPGDIRELAQAAEQADVELVLIIASNEPLRLWARGQGFTAFSSIKTYILSRLSSTALALPAPKTPGQFKVPGAPMMRQTSRITEPLYKRSEAASGDGVYGPYGPAYVQSGDMLFARPQSGDTPVDIQLIDIQKALHRQIAEEKAQDSLSQPLSLLSSATLPAYEGMEGREGQAPVGEQGGRPRQAPVATRGEWGEEQAQRSEQSQTEDLVSLAVRQAPRTIWNDRLLFILVALLALGIVGGLSFGYLLSAAHSASATLLPASLALVQQVVHS